MSQEEVLAHTEMAKRQLAQSRCRQAESHVHSPHLQVRYVKQMAKHRVGLGRELLQQGHHMLLLRSPQGVIQSFAEVLEPTLHETCFPMLCEIYSELRAAG